MSGLLQTVEYLGYTLLLSYALFLMLGALGFFAGFRFINCM